MTDTPNDMIGLIYKTKAVSIWNQTTGPVFWYAAGVPGPFYVNTELIIGADLAETLLEKITAIVSTTQDAKTRAAQLNDLILDAYHNNPDFENIITALAAKAEVEFPTGSYDIISGGERRDWLFSIPLAYRLGIPHVFLFKNKEFYSTTEITPGQKALHVADLINNAASYFDSWFPILDHARLSCAGTLCINTRGTNGLNRLRDHGQKVASLNAIDISFFESSLRNGLINQATLDEMIIYFDSPQEWGRRYLIGNPAIFDVQHIDKKSLERLQSFFQKDPWSLRNDNAVFFATITKAIQQRLNA